MTHKFFFEITVTYSTLNETGEVLSKQAASGYYIFNPEAVTHHEEKYIVVTVEGKKSGETWARACSINVLDQEETMRIKATYPQSHYYTNGMWVKAK